MMLASLAILLMSRTHTAVTCRFVFVPDKLQEAAAAFTPADPIVVVVMQFYQNLETILDIASI